MEVHIVFFLGFFFFFFFFQKLKYGLHGVGGENHTFDGGDFALQGSCNYPLVLTTCAGLNACIPLKSNIVGAYLSSATLSNIHLVQIRICSSNISLVKDDLNHVKVG